MTSLEHMQLVPLTWCECICGEATVILIGIFSCKMVID